MNKKKASKIDRQDGRQDGRQDSRQNGQVTVMTFSTRAQSNFLPSSVMTVPTLPSKKQRVALTTS